MLNYEDRIKLREELFNELNSLHIICKYKESHKIHSIKSLYKVLRSNNILLEKYNTYIKQFRTEEEALYCLIHKDDFSNHICVNPDCNKLSEFYDKKHGYRLTCISKECKVLAFVQTNIERYNCKFPLQCNQFKDKVKKTMIERYGVEYSGQAETLMNKRKQTCLKRYGTNHPMKSKEIQEKTANTNIIRYGVKTPLQNDVVKEKIKKTNIERYGEEFPMRVNIVKEKFKRTNLERRNVENPFQSNDIKKQIIETNFKKYGRRFISQSHITNYDIWDDKIKFTNFIIEKYNKKGFPLRLNEVRHHFSVYPDTLKDKLKQLSLLDYFYIPESNLEVEFKTFLNNNNITEYKIHDRKTLFNDNTNTYLEIDFLLKDLKIGFEINDIETHNSLSENLITYKGKYYHSLKTALANQSNIRLIHIWEWELRDEDFKNKLYDWILNILNLSKTRIFARKCILKDVSIQEEKNFLNKYHLQGYRKSNYCLGLYHNNELIQLMSLCKPRYNKRYEYELLRLCTKYGYTVIGGANKLLKNFAKRCSPKSIISYCDISKFAGHVYTDMGFKLVKVSSPQITWCNEEMKHFNQSSLNMIGADRLLGTNFGKGSNNANIALNRGYIPVYNCGIGIYEFRTD